MECSSYWSIIANTGKSYQRQQGKAVELNMCWKFKFVWSSTLVKNGLDEGNIREQTNIPNSLRFWVKMWCQVHSCSPLLGPMVQVFFAFRLPWTQTRCFWLVPLLEAFPCLFYSAWHTHKKSILFRVIFYLEIFSLIEAWVIEKLASAQCRWS